MSIVGTNLPNFPPRSRALCRILQNQNNLNIRSHIHQRTRQRISTHWPHKFYGELCRHVLTKRMRIRFTLLQQVRTNIDQNLLYPVLLSGTTEQIIDRHCNAESHASCASPFKEFPFYKQISTRPGSQKIICPKLFDKHSPTMTFKML